MFLFYFLSVIFWYIFFILYEWLINIICRFGVRIEILAVDAWLQYFNSFCASGIREKKSFSATLRSVRFHLPSLTNNYHPPTNPPPLVTLTTMNDWMTDIWQTGRQYRSRIGKESINRSIDTLQFLVFFWPVSLLQAQHRPTTQKRQQQQSCLFL